MNRMLIVSLALAFGVRLSSAQLAMNAGDSYTFDFHLHYSGNITGPGPPCAPWSFFSPRIRDLAPGDSVLLEMFEEAGAGSGMSAVSGIYPPQGTVSTTYL